ncbi:Metal tolerance protein C1 [Phytophthora citrophthora]|uniref:Metal tolerance protein C1 n=1 Tax=Phytophthora citrophthora TaxID=4793 RepID=A0AAD9FYN0_9STRA|nr:Metal tolerance protein C1 [Phytophthora citrophthora]
MRMWRVRSGSSVVASLKPRNSKRFSPSRPLQWQQHDFRLAKHLANFSSETSGRTVQHQSEDETKATVPKFSQGDEAMKITRVGMYVNVAMAAAKGSVGLAIHSSALIADAAHSLSDLLSDVVTLWSVKVARLPPDPKHPYGYGKYEAVGSLSVGVILVLCGFGIGADGLQAMQDIWNGVAATSLPEFNIPFLSGIDRSTQWALALGATGASIAAKEALFRATVRIGEQANSKVLIANAWHHRTDAISSVVALGGIIGSMAGVPLLDPVAGMAVAAMIVKTGGEICLDSVQELTDNTVEAEVLETLQEVSRGVDDVLHVSQVRARRMGPYTLVDLRVHLDARTSISMAQQISKRVRLHILQQVPDVTEVLVHIDVQFNHCAGSNSAELHEMDVRPYKEIKNDISYTLATIPEITGTTHINTHWLPHLGGQGTVVDVAIVVQPDLKVGAANAVAKKARRAIEAIPYIVEADIHLELQDDDSEQN